MLYSTEQNEFTSKKFQNFYISFENHSPITDMSVETAVSVALTASSKTDGEQDSMEVMENPSGR